MKALNDKELEFTFSSVCKNRVQAAAPDLWPGVEDAITRGRKNHSGLYRRLGFAGAFAAVAIIVLVFAAPGFTQNAIERLKRLLIGDFSFTLGGAEVYGILISEDGEQKELNIDGNVLKVRMSSMSENTMLIAVEVYLKNEAGEIKLSSKPKIVAVKGKPATITVSGRDGKMLYKFSIIPDEDAGAYRGNISKSQ